MVTTQQLRTVHGYPLNIVVSAMQKEIRRGNTKVAGYFAIEMFKSNYDQYCWRRLLTISAEDCYGIITQEIKALFDSYKIINTPRKKGMLKGRVFLSKAVIVLSEGLKSRDADHLTNFVYDRDMIDAKALAACIDEEMAQGHLEEPEEYVYDYHTREGRTSGHNIDSFCIDEHQALHPFQAGLFDDVIETCDRGKAPLPS